MPHLSPATRKLLWIFAIIALIGFADAAYLTASHYLSLPLPCGGSKSCELVTTSSYSEFYGIPVALFGALYYFIVLISTLIALDKNSARFARIASHLTIIGLLSSSYFMFVQFFLIKAICIYCTVSAALCLTLFVISFFIRKGLKASNDGVTPVTNTTPPSSTL